MLTGFNCIIESEILLNTLIKFPTTSTKKTIKLSFKYKIEASHKLHFFQIINSALVMKHVT